MASAAVTINCQPSRQNYDQQIQYGTQDTHDKTTTINYNMAPTEARQNYDQ